ncbi:MAG: hypothetical protein VW270_10510 [Candidatus Poseidoniales archaeon]
MALEDQIRTLDWKSNFEESTNVALSGKRHKAFFGNHYWSFRLQTPPLTREDFQNNFAVLFNEIDTTATIQIKPGILHDGKGGASATNPTSGTYTISSTTRGQDSVFIDLDDATGAGMRATFGDFFQLGTHDKLYMIRDHNVSLDPTDYGGAPVSTDRVYIHPPQIQGSASNTSIKFNDLSVKVVGIGDTNEFKTNRDGYFVFEKEVREVY